MKNITLKYFDGSPPASDDGGAYCTVYVPPPRLQHISRSTVMNFARHMCLCECVRECLTHALIVISKKCTEKTLYIHRLQKKSAPKLLDRKKIQKKKKNTRLSQYFAVYLVQNKRVKAKRRIFSSLGNFLSYKAAAQCTVLTVLCRRRYYYHAYLSVDDSGSGGGGYRVL